MRFLPISSDDTDNINFVYGTESVLLIILKRSLKDQRIRELEVENQKQAEEVTEKHVS